MPFWRRALAGLAGPPRGRMSARPSSRLRLTSDTCTRHTRRCWIQTSIGKRLDCASGRRCRKSRLNGPAQPIRLGKAVPSSKSRRLTTPLEREGDRRGVRLKPQSENRPKVPEREMNKLHLVTRHPYKHIHTRVGLEK
jgi:hypothetical protein